MSNVLVLVNLIGLFFMEVFFQSGISITHDAPASMAPGSQVKVTVTVEKGAMGGFAKLQIDLPEGFTATVVDSKGASFTFDDQKAKFIWMSLPTSPSFKVSYTLAAAATVSGKLPISGRFSYIEDNERKTHELPPTVIDLGGAAMATELVSSDPPTVAEPVAEEPNIEEPKRQEPVASDVAATTVPPVSAPVVSTQAPAIAAEQGAGNVSATRIITMVSENELLVEVLVNKGNIRGFGKLQETLPLGFTAMEKNSATAIFTAQDRIAKFVWLNLPAGNEVKLTYKLVSKTAQPGEHSVNGEFGYLLNDETQRAVLGSTNFSIGAEAWAAHQLAAQQQEQQAVVIDQPARTTEPAATSTEPASTTAQNTRESQRINRVPAPETGVTYKVQISAAHREVGTEYFQARHRFSGDFGIERHEGWIKYTTGRYAAYKEARDQRQGYVSAGHNFPGPFVTAYNNGERITVQEALMISQQRWVQ